MNDMACVAEQSDLYKGVLCRYYSDLNTRPLYLGVIHLKFEVNCAIFAVIAAGKLVNTKHSSIFAVVSATVNIWKMS